MVDYQDGKHFPTQGAHPAVPRYIVGSGRVYSCTQLYVRQGLAVPSYSWVRQGLAVPSYRPVRQGLAVPSYRPVRQGLTVPSYWRVIKGHRRCYGQVRQCQAVLSYCRFIQGQAVLSLCRVIQGQAVLSYCRFIQGRRRCYGPLLHTCKVALGENWLSVVGTGIRYYGLHER